MEQLIDRILTLIKNKPMKPNEIAIKLMDVPQDDIDHAIQIILERGLAAPNLEWKLTLNRPLDRA